MIIIKTIIIKKFISNKNKNKKLESFSIYNTNKNIKKKEMKINQQKVRSHCFLYSLCNNKQVKKVGAKKRKRKRKKDDKNNSEKNDTKIMIINNDSLNKMNDYINSVLIPFIVKSFDFINKE